jgi:hypothetical protein
MPLGCSFDWYSASHGLMTATGHRGARQIVNMGRLAARFHLTQRISPAHIRRTAKTLSPQPIRLRR